MHNCRSRHHFESSDSHFLCNQKPDEGEMKRLLTASNLTFEVLVEKSDRIRGCGSSTRHKMTRTRACTALWVRNGCFLSNVEKGFCWKWLSQRRLQQRTAGHTMFLTSQALVQILAHTDLNGLVHGNSCQKCCLSNRIPR